MSPLALVKNGKVVTWGDSPGWKKGCEIVPVSDEDVRDIIAAWAAPDPEPLEEPDPPAASDPPPG